MSDRPKRPNVYPPESNRTLPASVDAEKGLLSSFFIAPLEVGNLCSERGISEDHFWWPAHGSIFVHLMAMWDAREPIDLVTFAQRLHDRRVVEPVGGHAAVSVIATMLPTAANATAYLDTLEQKRVLRTVVKVGTEAIGRAYHEQEDVDGLLDTFEKDALAIRPKNRAQRAYTGRDIARMGIEGLEKRIAHNGRISGLPTGFADLDRKTDGLHETELIVLAARPGKGKSSLGGQIAEFLSLDCRIPVGVFSLEMGAQLLSERFVASRARVNTARWRHGQRPTDADVEAIQRSADQFTAAPIYVEELSDATVQHLRAGARRMAMKGVRLIIIDSLSKLRSDSNQARQNREREVSEAIGGLKEMAKELKIAVMVIVHLARSVDALKRGERPTLANLRESGSIEADADSVWMLYETEDGGTGLYLPKQRAGPPGEEVALEFEKEFTRFREPGGDEQPPLIEVPAQKKPRHSHA